jgi:hypothetical protein
LASGAKKRDSESIAEKMRALKPFQNIVSKPNAQYGNKKQRGYGIK